MGAASDDDESRCCSDKCAPIGGALHNADCESGALSPQWREWVGGGGGCCVGGGCACDGWRRLLLRRGRLRLRRVAAARALRGPSDSATDALRERASAVL